MGASQTVGRALAFRPQVRGAGKCAALTTVKVATSCGGVLLTRQRWALVPDNHLDTNPENDLPLA